MAHLPVYATTPLGYELGMHHEDKCIIDASEENDQCQNIFDMASVLGNCNLHCFHMYIKKNIISFFSLIQMITKYLSNSY